MDTRGYNFRGVEERKIQAENQAPLVFSTASPGSKRWRVDSTAFWRETAGILTCLDQPAHVIWSILLVGIHYLQGLQHS